MGDATMNEDLDIYVLYLATIHPDLTKGQIKSRKSYFKRTHIIDKNAKNYLDPDYSDVDVKFYIFKTYIVKYNKNFLNDRIGDFDLQSFAKNYRWKYLMPVVFVDYYFWKGFDQECMDKRANMKCDLKRNIRVNKYETPTQKLYLLLNELKYYKLLNKQIKQ